MYFTITFCSDNTDLLLVIANTGYIKNSLLYFDNGKVYYIKKWSKKVSGTDYLESQKVKNIKKPKKVSPVFFFTFSL